MILEKVGMLAVDSYRSRAYLSALKRNNLIPAFVLFLDSGEKLSPMLRVSTEFDYNVSTLDLIKSMDIPYEKIDTLKVNSRPVIEKIQQIPVDVFIFSGPSGLILKKEILSLGKKFLHVHPGLLPQFQGSTTIYYTLLKYGNCSASAIFLDEQIDTGPILATKIYPPPKDRTMLDYGYDPYIRSDLLVQVLKEYQIKGEFQPRKQEDKNRETYYIMHPVLRHIAILSQRNLLKKGMKDE